MKDNILERRKEVWLALSDFYLDTELQSFELNHIRDIFQQSGFTETEIKRINYEEVAPVLLDNLRGVVGVWGGFNEQWVIERIMNRLNRPRIYPPWWLFSWLWRKQVDYYTKSYFEEVFGS